MSAAETASPSPAAATADGAGVASKPSPSRWTPNADAAEWTPSFAVTTVAPVVASGEGKGTANAAPEAGSAEVSLEPTGVSESKVDVFFVLNMEYGVV